MAPEQLLGAPVDHRCDIFALGVVAYEAAVGAAPFAGDDITQIMYRIVNAAPPAPSAVSARLPPLLDFVLARALAKDPAGRYQDAREFAADLRRCAAAIAAAPPADADDEATQTLSLGAVAPGAASVPAARSPVEPAPLLPISSRFDSTVALQRLAAAGDGAALERTVRLDRAALAAPSEPPAIAPRTVAAPPPARRTHGGLLAWIGVAAAALVAAAIAFG